MGQGAQFALLGNVRHGGCRILGPDLELEANVPSFVLQLRSVSGMNEPSRRFPQQTQDYVAIEGLEIEIQTTADL